MTHHLTERLIRLAILGYLAGMAAFWGAVLGRSGVLPVVVRAACFVVPVLALAIPVSLILGLCAGLLLRYVILPVRKMLRHAPRGVFPAGCCDSCGYDLRETPARCPECATSSTSPR